MVFISNMQQYRKLFLGLLCEDLSVNFDACSHEEAMDVFRHGIHILTNMICALTDSIFSEDVTDDEKLLWLTTALQILWNKGGGVRAEFAEDTAIGLSNARIGALTLLTQSGPVKA